ncbi:hypothetical protein TWF481_003021 [Arthrobotrys musiformis]|uniref:F-box domain-containing protein n=1 Tax=Arthrobotrys musiformis TaxID=47236 RepID=A0AAV9VRX9_9PEZI
MTPVTSLPSEIFDVISEDLGEDDLLALRMTCKTLNAKAREAHLNSIYRCRRVFLIPTSLENLVKISKHSSGVNLRVRHVQISILSPYSRGFRNWLINGPIEMFEQTENGQSAEIESTLVAMEGISAAQSPEVGCREEHKSLLALAFSKFPNLRTLRIGERDGDLVRSEVNLFYPSLGLVPGNYLPRNLVNAGAFLLGSLKGAYEQAWDIAISAVTASGIPTIEIIETMGTPDGGGIVPFGWFSFSPQDLSHFRSAFHNLRSLQITLNVPQAKYENWNSQPLHEWLNVVGTNVVELKLSSDYFAGISLPMVVGLPKLRRLTFEQGYLNLDSLIEFSDRRRDTLEELNFLKCNMENPKKSWFMLMKRLMQGPRRLQRLRFISYKPFDDDMELDLEYILPDLEVRGSLASRESECKVTCPLDEENAEIKFIAKELEAHEGEDGFWESLTDGMWRPENIQGLYDYDDESNDYIIDSDSDLL